MAEELRLFQPSEYYSLFIDNEVRPDGRKLNSFGSTSIVIGCLGTANGSALVNLRETTISCGIKAELTNPTPENPKKGFIVPNIDFPPVCSSRFMPGPPSEEAQVLSQLIANVLTDSSLINLEDLCIVEGKLCWCLYIDITCLNYGGNVIDACMLSLVSAAKNVTLPNVSVEDGKVEVGDVCNPLVLSDMVFSCTFAVFNNSIVADPTTEEEFCALGTVSVFMKENGTICNIFMHRGCTITESCLKKCILHSRKQCKKLATIVNGLIPCEKKN